jgi:hypothetical protein
MAYGFNTETKSESSSRQFSSGIHENVELTSVSFASPKKDGTGDPSLLFDFTGPNGETFRHIEWEVGDQATDVAKSQEALAKRVKHILTKFIPEEKAILSGHDYASFCQGVVLLLGTEYVGKKVAIKLLYVKDNLRFTKYCGFIGKDAKDLYISKNEESQLVKAGAAPSSQGELELGIVDDGITDELKF